MADCMIAYPDCTGVARRLSRFLTNSAEDLTSGINPACCLEAKIDAMNRQHRFDNRMHLSSVEQRRIQFRGFAEVHVERHHVALAQGVDGRVCNLGKSLLAVVPNRTWETRQEGRGSVIAHAPEGFLAVFDERLEEHAELVFRPAEGCHQTV